jgi:hypothetical protein
MMTDTNQMIPAGSDQPDDELRSLLGLKNCLFHARVCNGAVARARKARGADTTEVEDGLDHLLELERGITRAIERRERELGALVRRAEVSL